MKITWVLVALLSGAFLPVQAGLNTRLGKAVASPVHASLVSFLTGVLALGLYIWLTRQPVSWGGFKEVPFYAWLGGVLGAFYVTAIIWSFPVLGPGLTFGLVVAGQMITAVFLDHFNILVARQHDFNAWKLLGIILIVTGVVLIRK